MKKEPFYPYDFPKHMCDHCEERYEWEKGVTVIANNDEVFSGHTTCMHMVYAKLKDIGRI